MQPYFLPYIGYFQLIHSVDTYVNLDHVSFMKRSYMTRNTLKNGILLNLQVNKGSQNKRCKDVTVNFENKWTDKTIKTLSYLYKKDLNYDEIMDLIIIPNFRESEISISEFNFNIIKQICNYLDIEKNFIGTSDNITSRKKGDGLIDICKDQGINEYVNAIGGTKLYSKDYFIQNGVKLEFCMMENNMDLKDPYRSILDIIFTYPKDHIKREIEKYSLI